MTALCVRGRAGLSPRWFSAALFLLAFAGPAAAEPIIVALDQATVMKLPDRASTVVIGNPLIADVTLQPNAIAIVTGKGYGATNVIVMDRTGTVLMEKAVEVKGPSDKIVVVYRGVDRETYSCTPICSSRITLGDSPDYFTKTLTEATLRNTQATAAGAGAAR